MRHRPKRPLVPLLLGSPSQRFYCYSSSLCCPSWWERPIQKRRFRPRSRVTQAPLEPPQTRSIRQAPMPAAAPLPRLKKAPCAAKRKKSCSLCSRYRSHWLIEARRDGANPLIRRHSTRQRRVTLHTASDSLRWPLSSTNAPSSSSRHWNRACQP